MHDVLEAVTARGVQDGCDSLRTIRLLLQARHTPRVQGREDVTDGADGTAHQLRNGLRGQPSGPGEDDVGTLETEGVRGAASGLQLPTLTRRHLPSPLAPSRRSPPASSPSLVHLAWWQMASSYTSSSAAKPPHRLRSYGLCTRTMWSNICDCNGLQDHTGHASRARERACGRCGASAPRHRGQTSAAPTGTAGLLRPDVAAVLPLSPRQRPTATIAAHSGQGAGSNAVVHCPFWGSDPVPNATHTGHIRPEACTPATIGGPLLSGSARPSAALHPHTPNS